MPKIIHFDIHGIKCDMPDCGWNDMSVKIEDYPQWLNRPCPNCQGNLLTERDFNLTNKMIRMSKVINALFGWLAWLTPKKLHDTEEHAVTFNTDGRGFFTEVNINEASETGKLLVKKLNRGK